MYKKLHPEVKGEIGTKKSKVIKTLSPINLRKKFDNPQVIEHTIHSQEGCTLLITLESFAECRKYRRLIPELSLRDVVYKRPDLVKHLIFQNFKKVHMSKVGSEKMTKCCKDLNEKERKNILEIWENVCFGTPDCDPETCKWRKGYLKGE